MDEGIMPWHAHCVVHHAVALVVVIREQRNASHNGFFKFLLVYAVRILKETNFLKIKIKFF